jgi:PAS domain S-box-containing protein
MSTAATTTTTTLGCRHDALALKAAAAAVTSSSRRKIAADRLSANLSQKREDLLAENMKLRRKEVILRSIPDLIIAFDSSGCMTFVSQSVDRFLDFTSCELENTSFWNRLSEDSSRLVKLFFMDALAVKRNPEDDTTALADGKLIPVRLIDKDGNEENGLPFALRGVVHFAANSPECVCTLCPKASNAHRDLVHSNTNANQVSDGS